MKNGNWKKNLEAATHPEVYEDDAGVCQRHGQGEKGSGGRGATTRSSPKAKTKSKAKATAKRRATLNT